MPSKVAMCSEDDSPQNGLTAGDGAAVAYLCSVHTIVVEINCRQHPANSLQPPAPLTHKAKNVSVPLRCLVLLFSISKSSASRASAICAKSTFCRSNGGLSVFRKIIALFGKCLIRRLLHR